MSAIVVNGLTHRYGDFTALDEVDFDVAPGATVALLGRNGAGKTTTMEILEGFLTPTAGAVRVLDADPARGGRVWRRRVGLVLQSTSLDEQLTVIETLQLFAGARPDDGEVSRA